MNKKIKTVLKDVTRETPETSASAEKLTTERGQGMRTYSWTQEGVKYICTQKSKKSVH